MKPVNTNGGGGTPDGPPDDRDPVRSSPPADPWLTEAPTSALGDATPVPGPDPASAQVPLADTARFDDATPVPARVPPVDTAGFGGAAPAGWAGMPPPQRRRGRRVARWIVAILAACALFIGGMLAVDLFGDGSDGDSGARAPGPSTGANHPPVPAITRTGQQPRSTSGPTGAASSGPTGAASAGPQTGGPVVVYRVTASGSHNTGSVSYTNEDGDIIRLSGIALPWRTTFTVGTRPKPPLVLITQRIGGGDNGPVTCTITLDGKLLSSTTAEGRYAAPQCSG